MILVVVCYPDTKYIEAHQHEDKTSSEGFEMHLHADRTIPCIELPCLELPDSNVF